MVLCMTKLPLEIIIPYFTPIVKRKLVLKHKNLIMTYKKTKKISFSPLYIDFTHA